MPWEREDAKAPSAESMGWNKVTETREHATEVTGTTSGWTPDVTTHSTFT